jgi:hypothetical protein
MEEVLETTGHLATVRVSDCRRKSLISLIARQMAVTVLR